MVEVILVWENTKLKASLRVLLMCSLEFSWQIFYLVKFIRRTFRFVAVLLAFIVGLTSMGFALHVHYCQGKAVSVALFEQADHCGKQQRAPHACQLEQGKQLAPALQKRSCDQACSIGERACCKDEVFLLQDQQDKAIKVLEAEGASKALPLPVFAPMPNSDQCALPVFFEKERAPIVYLSPPILRDIPVLIQSFLF